MKQVILSKEAVWQVLLSEYNSGRNFGYTVNVGQEMNLSSLRSGAGKKMSSRGNDMRIHFNYVRLYDYNQSNKRPERGGWRTVNYDKIVSVRTKGVEFVNASNPFNQLIIKPEEL